MDFAQKFYDAWAERHCLIHSVAFETLMKIEVRLVQTGLSVVLFSFRGDESRFMTYCVKILKSHPRKWVECSDPTY